MVYGDEYVRFDLGHLLRRYRLAQGIGALVVAHRVEAMAGRNLLEMKHNRRITHLWGKGQRVALSGWACSGIYVLPAYAPRLVPPSASDLENDLLPALLSCGAEVRAYCVPADQVVDIGKMEGYERANRLAALDAGP